MLGLAEDKAASSAPRRSIRERSAKTLTDDECFTKIEEYASRYPKGVNKRMTQMLCNEADLTSLLKALETLKERELEPEFLKDPLRKITAVAA